jgi:hypothetical protein
VGYGTAARARARDAKAAGHQRHGQATDMKCA